MPRPPILNRGRTPEGRTTRVSPPLGAGFQPAALSLVKIPAVELPLLGALCALCALCAVGVIARIAAPPSSNPTTQAMDSGVADLLFYCK